MVKSSIFLEIFCLVHVSREIFPSTKPIYHRKMCHHLLFRIKSGITMTVIFVKKYLMFGASLQSGSRVPGSGSQKSWCIKTRLNLGTGPRTRDTGPNKSPKGWQINLHPFARSQMLGLQVPGGKYGAMTNVHVSTKLTVGTSEHSFKSVDEGR